MNRAGIIRLAAFMVILTGIMQVFIITMHPSFKNNDSPETAAAAQTLSIGHPPGYPLFSLAGKLFTLLPAGNTAFRVNLFSVFLAIMTLFATAALIPLLSKTAGKERDAALLFTVIALAFSYIFWDQALEAKGGIYMLNLLLFAACLYFSLSLIGEYTPRHLYMLCFLSGLSLANHWPSMLVIFPVLFAPALLKFRQARPSHYMLALAFFALGLTPYIYLPLRAAGNAVLNWGDPRTPAQFMWVIMRSGYSHQPVAPSMSVFAYHIKEFFFMVFNNYSLLWVLAAAGITLGLMKKRGYAYVLTSVFLVYFTALVFINRTPQGIIYLMHIFMLPAEYALILLSAAALLEIRAERRARLAVFGAAIACALALVFLNFRSSNNSRNYIAYDYGGNILKTLEKDSVYIGDGDYNLMPVYYYQEVMRERRDVIFTNPSFLIFGWGIKDFQQKYSPVIMKPFDTDNNIKNIIEHYIGTNHVYRSSHFPRQQDVQGVWSEVQKGMLVEYSASIFTAPYYYYDIYSYRGMFSPFCLKVKNNTDTATWYPVCMVNQANALMSAGKNDAAISLYKRALSFPFEKPEGNIYYNLSMAYGRKGDTASELTCLSKAAEKNTEIVQAYERAGELYYNVGVLELARKMFVEAKSRGSKNELVNKAISVIQSIPPTDWLELALMKGNEAIVKNNLALAMHSYKFLLEKGYKKAIIYRNIGVCHFKTGNYDEAIENFKLSNNETQAPDVYLYLGYTYYSMGNKQEALNQAQEGLKRFPSDKGLADFYSKLAGETGNVKDTGGINRQR